MKNKGSVYASDINIKRLENMKPRVKRAGIDNIRLLYPGIETDKKIKRLRGKFDCVLIDAPCSGFGALRRNPDSAWKIGQNDLAVFSGKQLQIINDYSNLVKPGGRLVYSTCSILEQENENVISEFISEKNDFKICAAEDIFKNLSIKLKFKTEFMKLYPHIHNTDGFFAAVLTRSL